MCGSRGLSARRGERTKSSRIPDICHGRVKKSQVYGWMQKDIFLGVKFGILSVQKKWQTSGMSRSPTRSLARRDPWLLVNHIAQYPLHQIAISCRDVPAGFDIMQEEEEEEEEEKKGSKPTALTRGCARPREDAAYIHLNTWAHTHLSTHTLEQFSRLAPYKNTKKMFYNRFAGAIFAFVWHFWQNTYTHLNTFPHSHIHNKRCKDWKLKKNVLGCNCDPFVCCLSCMLFEFFVIGLTNIGLESESRRL